MVVVWQIVPGSYEVTATLNDGTRVTPKTPEIEARIVRVTSEFGPCAVREGSYVKRRRCSGCGDAWEPADHVAGECVHCAEECGKRPDPPAWADDSWGDGPRHGYDW